MPHATRCSSRRLAVWLAVLALCLLLALPGGTPRAQPVPDVDGARYNTAELINRTLSAMPSCLNYCLLGIELRMRVTLTGVRFYLVPRVRHYMASMHVMAFDEPTREPYREWAGIMGTVQKFMLDRLANLLTVVESGGRRTRYAQHGRHQATRFKETALMGHPVAIVPSLLDGSGTVREPDYDALGDYDPPNGAEYNRVISRFVDAWADRARGCIGDPLACPVLQPAFPADFLRRYFDLVEAYRTIASAMETLAQVMELVEMAGELREIAALIGGDFGVGGSVRVDRLLCPVDVTPFYPYYLSGPDALFWRSGWPITDARHTATVLNPFSSDVIRYREELWGHIYPRHGFLNHDHDAKAAVVMSERGAHLVSDPSVRLRPVSTNRHVEGHWQKLSPGPTGYCAPSSTELPVPIDDAGGYGYNIWSENVCSLSDVGSVVAFIPYRVCF